MSTDTDIKKKLKKQDGFLLVETAVVLPVFIIAVITIGYVIIVIGTMETLNHAVCDEMSNLAAHSYKAEASAIGFKGALKKRVENDAPRLSNVSIDEFGYLFSDSEADELISVEISGHVDFDLPLRLYGGTDIRQQWLTRAFKGTRSRVRCMPFDEMGYDGDSVLVYVFPDSGTKYHAKNCTYVEAHVSQMILGNDIMKNYSPCRVCHAESLKAGNTVYCFLKYGGAYHRGNCRTIDRYTMSMPKEDAVEKGYVPCSKCGGE